MITFHKKISLKSDIERVYNLISEVQKYHEFVPWCSASNVISNEVLEKDKESGSVILERLVADLYIKFGIITQKYSSLVFLRPPRNVTPFSKSLHDKKIEGNATPWQDPSASNDIFDSLKQNRCSSFKEEMAFGSRSIEENLGEMYVFASVIVQGVESGAIQSLKTSWELTQKLQGNTEVDFHIEIALSSKTLSSMLSALFPSLCEKMVDAFSKRLNYSKSS